VEDEENNNCLVSGMVYRNRLLQHVLYGLQGWSSWSFRLEKQCNKMSSCEKHMEWELK